MITFNFLLLNPFHREHENSKFRDNHYKIWKLSTHKFFEVQYYRYAYYWLEIGLDTNFYTDHGGTKLYLNLFGFNFHAQFYDNRHWNRETHSWEDKSDIH
jgi:hypothetical protein